MGRSEGKKVEGTLCKLASRKRICSVCGEEKELTNFGKIGRRCRHCTNIYMMSWRKNRREVGILREKDDPLRAYGRNLKKNYGMSIEEYLERLEEQNGLCAICMEVQDRDGKARHKRLCVDHDHYTGKIRGLLCQRCNRGIGLLQDNYQVLCKAFLYLRNHGAGKDDLRIVSHCPLCGAPIYGYLVIDEGSIPIVRRSCSCFPQSKSFSDQIQTK